MIEGVSPLVEQGVYRVAQEALENIARHASAKHIQVWLTLDGPRLELHIRDDGQGFEEWRLRQIAEARDNGHFGIRGMQERAAMIGGDFSVSTQPEEGTTVRLGVPLWEDEALVLDERFLEGNDAARPDL
jgi:signal transduction histidine kinase